MRCKLRPILSLLIITAILISSSLACANQETETPTATPTQEESTSVPVATATPSKETPSPTPEVDPTPTPGGPLVHLPDLSPLVHKVAPAVVLVTTEATGFNFFMQPIPQEGAGTGVIIDSRGYIVTNNHVVEGAESIKVTLADGRIFDVDPESNAWTDPLTDLAVIRIEGDDLPTAQFADPESITPYQWVMAIGYPFKLEGEPTVTAGIISATGRYIEEPNGVVLYDLIQISAAINPGNSGGPLVNLAGEVMGINTAIITGSQNIGFSISAGTVIPVVEDLMTKGYVIRPYLGIYMLALDQLVVQRFGLSTEEGVMITSVTPSSPAAGADLRVGDVIIEIDKEKVTTLEELRVGIQSHQPGERMEITFMRVDETLTVTVTLGETPPPE